ncbi:MAG: hypothetical protein QG652_1175, partial [Pseudomonadota bacterium]|nr:hypothetical protein [Pseudomonadota bacterium]
SDFYSLVDCCNERHVVMTLSEQLKILDKLLPEETAQARMLLNEPVAVDWFEGVRQAIYLNKTCEDFSYTRQPRCYIKLLRKILFESPEYASATEWLGRLNNIQSEGVAESEIWWSGLLDVLNSYPPEERLSKYFLLRHTHHYDLTPVMFVVNRSRSMKDDGFKAVEKREYATKQQQGAERILHYTSQGEQPCSIYHHINHDMPEKSEWWTLEDKNGQILLAETGYPYRFISAEQAMQYAQQHGYITTKQLPDYSKRSFMKYSLPGGDDYTEWLIALPALMNAFHSNHYNFRNVLLHARTTVREVKGIGRFLLIDELQSDWNQQGRIHGFFHNYDDIEKYTRPVPGNPYEKNWAELGLRMMLMYAAEHQLDGIAWSSGDIQINRYRMDEESARRGMRIFYDEIISNTVRKIGKVWNIPLRRMAVDTCTRNLYIEQTSEDEYIVRLAQDDALFFHAYQDEPLARRIKDAFEQPIHEIVQGLVFSETMKQELKTCGLPFAGAIENHSSKNKA